MSPHPQTQSTPVQSSSGLNRALAALKLATKPFQPRNWRAGMALPTQSTLQQLLQHNLQHTAGVGAACALLNATAEPVLACAGTTRQGGTTAIEPHSLFHVGSTTKSMTAVLIAQLVAQGKLRYESTLGELLPGYPLHTAYAQRSVFDLLLNRAGVLPLQRLATEPPEVVQRLWREIPSLHAEPTVQRQHVTQWVLQRPPLASGPPQSVYSNPGWAVLGHLVERCLDMSYEDALVQRVLAPLGIHRFKLGGWPTDDYSEAEPVGHYAPASAAEPLRAQSSADNYRFPDWVTPAGGVNLDLEGFARYAQEHLRGLRGGGELLSADQYRYLHQIHTRVAADVLHPGSGTSQRVCLGLGWGMERTPFGLFSLADGSGGTFYARLALLPSFNIAFVGLVNSGAAVPLLDRMIYGTTGFRM